MLKIEPGKIEFDYVNYKGRAVHRRAEVTGIRWGTSEYYTSPCWLMDGVDVDRNVRRTYNMGLMANVQHLA